MELNNPFTFLFKTDVSYLKSLVSKVDKKLWYEKTFRQELYEVHKKTLSIVFKWTSNSQENLDKSFINYDLLNSILGKEVELQIKKILKYYPKTLISKAMLAYVAPKSEIKEHIDSGILQKIHRIHLPIITNPKCIFNIDKKNYFPKEGECFEFDNTKSHFINNMGNTPRIHLILDLLKK
tara:strand:- start:979 stop:1518 length:540 start_codon:yes stop_codon:yes gene_type:complete